ncbi:MAG TPA: ABC transporter ATP-binding protein [Anaerovoracaceae bacterium]|nr:ABC transporter ATP-binding protein [Anaerovoracaceae bacterium]
MENNNYLLRIEDLKTYFNTLDGVVRAVNGVSFEIKPNETLGLVGESGCGKSVTALSILRLLSKRSKIVNGKIMFKRRKSEQIDLVKLDPQGDLICDIRGNEIAMIFQEPMTSLSPVHTIGDQIGEVLELHQGMTKKQAREKVIEMLTSVGLGMAEKMVDTYPHKISGGQRQRAMIAMALSCNPSLLIADEPTTALDVTIQAQILDLMKDLQTQYHTAILMITHNLGVIAEMAERVVVMYMGKVIEFGKSATLFQRPLHPYTVGLMHSIPKMGRDVKKRLVPIVGNVPDPFAIPKGCAFAPRCSAPGNEDCTKFGDIPLIEVEPGHFVRCRLYTE